MTTPSQHRGDFTVDKRLLRICVLSLVIGCASVILGFILIKGIAFFTNLFFFARLSFDPQAPARTFGIWTILIPAIGGAIIGLMARYGTDKIRGHGIPEAIEVILFGRSVMSIKVALLKPLSSAISIGSGGPFGAEGPIIMTGGAFGSIFGQLFRITPSERKCLLVAGAAAGMTAIFGTPLAAVLIAVELLLFEWRPRSLIPVSLACAVAYLLRPLFMDNPVPIFPMTDLPVATATQLATGLPFGIAMGAMAWVISSSLYKLEDIFDHLPIHWSWWPAIGGLFVGCVGYFEPRVMGVGYDLIAGFLQGNMSSTSSLQLVILKASVWIVALASGTSGGVLAPLLIIGAGMGTLLTPLVTGSTTLWALVAMAATIGGIMRAPLTAVLFALETTQQIHAVPILFVASMSSYLFTVLVMKRSILTEKIARRGRGFLCEYGLDPFDRHDAQSIMSKDVQSVNSHWTRAKLLDFYRDRSRTHRGYPVVNSDGTLCGVVTENDALQWSSGDPDDSILDLTRSQNLIAATPDESIRSIAEKMATAGVGRVPVVESFQSMKLAGIVTRSDLLRIMQSHHADENDRHSMI